MISLVLTCIGPDHPGLVESISETVSQHGANWEESRMARLAGQFAGILLLTVPDLQADSLMAALGKIEGLQVTIQQSAEDRPTEETEQQSYHLEVTGNDRPGIVFDLARILSARRINLEELSTECVDAAMTGGVLFQARAVLHIPSELDVEELRFQLESISDDWMVDLHPQLPEP